MGAKSGKGGGGGSKGGGGSRAKGGGGSIGAIGKDMDKSIVDLLEGDIKRKGFKSIVVSHGKYANPTDLDGRPLEAAYWYRVRYKNSARETETFRLDIGKKGTYAALYSDGFFVEFDVARSSVSQVRSYVQGLNLISRVR